MFWLSGAIIGFTRSSWMVCIIDATTGEMVDDLGTRLLVLYLFLTV